MATQIYDYIIIGGGLAGIYCYHRLQNMNPNLKIILLEKNDYVGGRMKDTNFYGTTIKLGGGVVDETCTHMLHLLKTFEIELSNFKSNLVDIYLPKFDINDAIQQIKQKYYDNEGSRIDLTVNDFLHTHFDINFIKLFYLYADYTDFHCQDINDFINSYPIDDLTRIEQYLCIFKYNDLFNKLKKNKNIILNYQVEYIQKNEINGLFIINDVYHTHNIITATTVNCLKKLFNYDFLDEIKSVPFCRNFIYSNDLSKIHKDVVLVKNELKKMIKINDNVLMIIYCDSNNANFWNKVNDYDKVKPGLQVKVIKKLLLENDPKLNIDIIDHLHHFWDEGIHYYVPENQMDRKNWIISNMNPEENVYVCGEMLSIKQGWMEGAVQSVDLLFDNYFKI